MAIKNDLTGHKYGKLAVLRCSGKNKHGVSLWLCQCDCGTTKVVDSMHMRRGATKSCGCHRTDELKNGRDQLHKDNTTHRGTGTREHHIWLNIKYRCYKKTSRQYPDYGGRGIVMCDKWRLSFENFLADMGLAPSTRHTIDRINNDGPYSPENCRWATPKQQMNNRRNSLLFTINGETKGMSDWAKTYGLWKGTVHRRLKKGLTIEQALGIIG